MNRLQEATVNLATQDLTLIFTTSPTPTAPSSELLDSVITSFRQHCSELMNCRVIVVFDTYDSIGPTARLKKGRVTQHIADNFEVYKAKIKQLILREFTIVDGECSCQSEAQAEYGSPGQSQKVVKLQISQTSGHMVTFIEPQKRLGFGLAVRSALRLVKTKYTWIHQHDWTLVADIPINDILSLMKASEKDSEGLPIKYICLPSIRLLEYAKQEHVMQFPALKEISGTLTSNVAARCPLLADVPLTPMFYWHDKPHIALTSHYLTRIFPSSLAMPRGAFIEDTVGQRARNQMKNGEWHKWATWLYYPDEGRRLCLRHLEGRTWEGQQGEEEKAKKWRALNAKTASEREVLNVEKETPSEKDDNFSVLFADNMYEP